MTQALITISGTTLIAIGAYLVFVALYYRHDFQAEIPSFAEVLARVHVMHRDPEPVQIKDIAADFVEQFRTRYSPLRNLSLINNPFVEYGNA